MKISIIKCVGDAFKKNKDKFLFFMGVGLLLLCWSLFSYVLKKPILVPSPFETMMELKRIVLDRNFGWQIGATILRFLVGFGITALFAMVLGILAGLFRDFANIFYPAIAFIKATPTMAIIILAIIWLKSDIAPVLVVFLISFPVLYAGWKTGIVETDKKLLEMAKLFGVPFSKVLREIYLPTSKPYVLAGISSALGLGFKVGIGAEVLCQPKYGIGSAFQLEKSNLNTAGVFAWAILCILLVGVLDFVVAKVIATKK